jgi:dUTP pyrophosphatase
MAMNPGESPKGFFTRIEVRIQQAALGADARNILAQSAFLKALPMEYQNHVRMQGLTDLAAQVQAAQGYFEVTHGKTGYEEAPAKKDEITELKQMITDLKRQLVIQLPNAPEDPIEALTKKVERLTINLANSQQRNNGGNGYQGNRPYNPRYQGQNYQPQQRQVAFQEPECYKCGKQGHISRNCAEHQQNYQPRQGPPQMPVKVTTQQFQEVTKSQGYNGRIHLNPVTVKATRKPPTEQEIYVGGKRGRPPNSESRKSQKGVVDHRDRNDDDDGGPSQWEIPGTDQEDRPDRQTPLDDDEEMEGTESEKPRKKKREIKTKARDVTEKVKRYLADAKIEISARDFLEITTPGARQKAFKQLRRETGRVPKVPQPEPIPITIVEPKHVSTYLRATIGPKPREKVLIDTGAAMCVISQNFLKSVGWGVKDASNITMVLADGGETPALGIVRKIPVTFGTGEKAITTVVESAIVTNATAYSMILGNPWLKEHAGVVDIGKQRLKFEHRGNKYSIDIKSMRPGEKPVEAKYQAEEDYSEDSEDSGTESDTEDDDSSEDEGINSLHFEDRYEDARIFEKFEKFEIGPIAYKQAETDSDQETPQLQEESENEQGGEEFIAWDDPQYQGSNEDEEWNFNTIPTPVRTHPETNLEQAFRLGRCQHGNRFYSPSSDCRACEALDRAGIEPTNDWHVARPKTPEPPSEDESEEPKEFTRLPLFQPRIKNSEPKKRTLEAWNAWTKKIYKEDGYRWATATEVKKRELLFSNRGYCECGQAAKKPYTTNCFYCTNRMVHVSQDTPSINRKQQHQIPQPQYGVLRSLPVEIYQQIEQEFKALGGGTYLNYLKAIDPVGLRGVNYTRDARNLRQWPRIEIAAIHEGFQETHLSSTMEETHPVIQCKLFSHFARIPERKNDGDVGYDLTTAEAFTLEPHEIKRCRTGVALQLPPNLYAQIFSRSSLASRGIVTEGGVIDNGYRGEIEVILINHSNDYHHQAAGTRIAQIVFLNYSTPKIEKKEELTETARGSKGFGSTEEAVHLLQVRKWRKQKGTLRRRPVYLKKAITLDPFEPQWIEISTPPNRRHTFFEPNEHLKNIYLEPVVCHDDQPRIHTTLDNKGVEPVCLPAGTVLGSFTPFLEKAYPPIYEFNLGKDHRRRKNKGKGKAPLAKKQQNLPPTLERSSHWRKNRNLEHC